jgi:hypothetical protein
MSLHLTGAAAVLMTRLMGSTKTSESLNVTGISLGSVCMLARYHFYRLAFRDVHRGPILRDLVTSPQHLHQAVWVLCPRQALKPDMCYLASVITDFCLDLSYALFQRHGGLNLQEADLRLQAGDLCLPRRGAELA